MYFTAKIQTKSKVIQSHNNRGSLLSNINVIFNLLRCRKKRLFHTDAFTTQMHVIYESVPCGGNESM